MFLVVMANFAHWSYKEVLREPLGSNNDKCLLTKPSTVLCEDRSELLHYIIKFKKICLAPLLEGGGALCHCPPF